MNSKSELMTHTRGVNEEAKGRESLKNKLKMDADKFEKYLTGRDLEVLANCVTSNSRTMKVSGQKEREKSLSNSYYIL